MKQVFYIIALLLAFFFSDSDSNNAYGQNMAQEHYNPWKGAEKTGEYYMERCKKCNIWITGYSVYELENHKEWHMSAKHPNLSPDENTDSSNPDENSSSTGSSGSSSESSSGNNYSNEVSLVKLFKVASAMQAIGICSYNQFLNDLNMYGIYENDGSVNASEIVGFIKWKYNARSNIDLNFAINNNYSFIIFTRPFSGEYYDVYTNRNYEYIDYYVCDYYIVF